MEVKDWGLWKGGIDGRSRVELMVEVWREGNGILDTEGRLAGCSFFLLCVCMPLSTPIIASYHRISILFFS